MPGEHVGGDNHFGRAEDWIAECDVDTEGISIRLSGPADTRRET
jgi:hypothetical protein